MSYKHWTTPYVRNYEPSSTGANGKMGAMDYTRLQPAATSKTKTASIAADYVYPLSLSADFLSDLAMMIGPDGANVDKAFVGVKDFCGDYHAGRELERCWSAFFSKWGTHVPWRLVLGGKFVSSWHLFI